MLPATPYEVGRAYSESRIPVDDGYIWPFARDRMVARGAIIERMLEDIAALVNDGGDAPHVTLQDLGALGWLPAQIEAHAPRAFALFSAAHRKPRRITGNRSTVRRPSRLSEAAAFACLAVPVVLWARHLLAGLN